ncbi:alanine racemase [Xanthomarina sp. F1114]|uniref:alanine racemase n=1 Tax=Xanthomarina sp. F1114 TaxID=2996019 RepID=UPI00225E472D|nr:alanine racemase [Xanthomarina sp. F1114]MCX7546490.1 alanine racemase [Xanthomarina sp. F1114]
MSNTQETVLEIDLKALQSNYKYLKSRITNGAKLMAVVKAYAYGSESQEVAAYLENLEIDYFAVAYANEGVALRDFGVTKPILVLHPQPVNYLTIIERCLEPSLYNFKSLNSFLEVAKTEKQENYPIHIKFNTGLNRLGFDEADIENIHSRLLTNSSVKVTSIFSHLAASEDLNEKEFTLNQIQAFKSISNKFIKVVGYKPMLHLCNTSGILNYPEAHLDMVRSGIGLYGFGNSAKEDVHFTPIATLKSVISQIHSIEKGETVGYNRAFKSDKLIRTATIPIGHADGIGRQYGNGKGFVTIHGKPAYIVGNVCMDMIMVEVTDIECKEGDEVIIFGKQPTASKFAERVNSISYEIITAISQRIKRLIIK